MHHLLLLLHNHPWHKPQATLFSCSLCKSLSWVCMTSGAHHCEDCAPEPLVPPRHPLVYHRVYTQCRAAHSQWVPYEPLLMFKLLLNDASLSRKHLSQFFVYVLGKCRLLCVEATCTHSLATIWIPCKRVNNLGKLDSSI